MSHRVIWRRRLAEALDFLIFIAYETGRDAPAIRSAAAEINARLAANPASEGESRDGPERVLIVHPLTVVFEAFEAERVVLIYSAVYYPRQRV